jgi:hypothetical protein
MFDYCRIGKSAYKAAYQLTINLKTAKALGVDLTAHPSRAQANHRPAPAEEANRNIFRSL